MGSKLLTVSHQAASAHTLHAPDRFIGDGILLYKTGRVGRFLSVTPTDTECLEAVTRDELARVFERAIRSLPTECLVTVYQDKTIGPEISRRTSHPNARAEELYRLHRDGMECRSAQLNVYHTTLAIEVEPSRKEAGLGANSVLALLYRSFLALFSWVARQRRLEQKLAADIETLNTAVAALMDQCGSDFSLQLLDTEETYAVLQRVEIADVHHRAATPVPLDYLDLALSRSAIECHATHLKVGENFATVIAMKQTPPATEAGVFDVLQTIPGRWLMVQQFRRVEEGAARRILSLKKKQRWANRMEYVLKVSLESNPHEEKLKSAAAYSDVEEVNGSEREVNEGHQLYQCSCSVIVYADTEAELRQRVAQIIRALNSREMVAVEETINRPVHYFAHWPGNHDYNLRWLYLLDTQVADLAPLSAPHPGEPWDPHFRDHALTVLETRSRTPYPFHLHDGDLAHTSLFGASGAGKSMFMAHIASQAQQYDPITVGFSACDSFRTLTRFCGGSYFELDPDNQDLGLPLFALPLTPETRLRLNRTVRRMMSQNSKELCSDHVQTIDEGLVSLYELDNPELRTLSTLASLLPLRLAKLLRPWTGDGQYARFFDRKPSEDTFQLHSFQWYDFRRLLKIPEVVPLFVDQLSFRIEQEITAPALRARPKFAFFDEAGLLKEDDDVRERLICEGFMTWRKYNGTVLLATQSLSDLKNPRLLEAVANNCPNLVFFSQRRLDEAKYASYFHLNEKELKLIEELRPKGELLLKQPHRAKVLTLNLDPKSYWLFTTNAYEAKRRDEVFAVHGMEKGLALLAQETRS